MKGSKLAGVALDDKSRAQEPRGIFVLLKKSGEAWLMIVKMSISYNSKGTHSFDTL